MPSRLPPSRSRSPRAVAGFGEFRLDAVGDDKAFDIIMVELEKAKKQHDCIEMLQATVQNQQKKILELEAQLQALTK